jgi:hypothetical protein
MRFATSLAVMLMFGGGCAHFLEPSSHHESYLAQQKQIAAASRDGGSDKICKRLAVTGSNMPKRICSTAAEWAAYEKQKREEADQFNQDLKNGGSPTAGESLP